MPVTTCSTNARNVALPNTYHHPVRGGTGCSSTPRVQVRRPVRSSSVARSRLITSASPERDLAREDLDLSRLHPYVIPRERPGRGPAGDGAVGVVHAAVAGTEEQLRAGEPLHRTAQMGAVNRERGEGRLVVPAKPGRGAGADPGPWKGGRVVELDGHGLADLEAVHRAHGSPPGGGLPGQRREEEAHDRHAHDGRGGRGQEDRDARKEAAPLEQRGRGVIGRDGVHAWLGREDRERGRKRRPRVAQHTAGAGEAASAGRAGADAYAGRAIWARSNRSAASSRCRKRVEGRRG